MLQAFVQEGCWRWFLWKPGKLLTLVLKIVQTLQSKNKKVYKWSFQERMNIQNTNYETEPCGLVSSTFKESIDLMSSTISPYLSGETGFQSACIQILKKSNRVS
jgi:hypothetical protein